MIATTQRRTILGTLLLLPSVCGCWTMANLNGQEHVFLGIGGQKPVRVYGGVRDYAEFVAEHIDRKRAVEELDEPLSWESLNDKAYVFVNGAPVFMYLGIVDPLISLAADTVTLPYALYKVHSPTGYNAGSLTGNIAAGGHDGQVRLDVNCQDLD